MPYRDYEQQQDYYRGRRDGDFGWSAPYDRSSDYDDGYREGHRQHERREEERAEEEREERLAEERRREAREAERYAEEAYYEAQQREDLPEPSDDEPCAPDHVPHGVDRFGDRCHCGRVRWLRAVK